MVARGTLRPAATVLLLRDGQTKPEVFMVRRHQAIAFMGGAYVFPGGSVDETDRGADGRWCDGIEHAERQLPSVSRDDASAVHVAAVRELFEEANVLLARDRTGDLFSLGDEFVRARFRVHREQVLGESRRFRPMLEDEGLRPALDLLIACAHWVTPAHQPQRFDTHFFAARMPSGQMAAHDNQETVESVWVTPARAIERARGREIVLPPPTWAMLAEIEPFQSVEDILAWCRARRIERREPELAQGDGARMMRVPGSAIRFVWEDGRWRPA